MFEFIKTLLVFGAVVFSYLLPSVVAQLRGHKNGNAICILNIVLGWTVLGWVFALIWSATDNVKKSEPIRWEEHDGKLVKID